jgi:hypothetical protein
VGVLVITGPRLGPIWFPADKLVRGLAKAGIAASAIHGNKSQKQRERVLSAFRSGDIRTLVATDIAARGIDVDGIGHVVNFDLPNVPETYVHRIVPTRSSSRPGVATSTSRPLTKERTCAPIDTPPMASAALMPTRCVDAHVAPVAREAIEDLAGQLARGAKHQDAVGLAFWPARVATDWISAATVGRGGENTIRAEKRSAGGGGISLRARVLWADETRSSSRAACRTIGRSLP